MISVRRIACGALIGLLPAVAGVGASGLRAAADPNAIGTGTAAETVADAAAATGPTDKVAPSVEITYLANEGFLIEAGSKKILIDALFDGATIDWCHVNSPGTLAKLGKADAPFDDIDLILTTHSHIDHFSAGPVMKHLTADAGTVFIGPPQAVTQLAQAVKQLEGEKPGEDRIIEVDLKMFASSEFEFDGIRIEAHRIHHSQFIDKDEETGEEINRHRDVENLAYLIEIDGLRLLHVGDAVLPLNREYLESERFPKGKIDIVFLEYFDFSEETKEILEPMRPDHIVFMHLPPQSDKIEKLSGYLWWNFPNAVLFKEPLERREL